MTSPPHQTPTVPVLPDVKQHLVSPIEPVIGRVVANRVCTARPKAAGFVRHIEIDVSGTPLEGNFRAGQSFGVVPPGEDDRGRPHKLRLYSIASPTRGEDGSGTILATTVKRTIDENWDDHSLFLGVCSNYLCNTSEGDEIMLTGPAGKRFLLPADPSQHDLIFFATGTGIAPFRAMLGDLEAVGFPSKVTLIMGAPYRSDLLYDQDFKDLAERHENFAYLPAISRELNRDCDRSLYVQDRLETHSDHFLEQLRSDRTLIYVCGIAGMEIGILQKLAVMLTPEELEPYLAVDPEIPQDPKEWDRRMIPRKLKPSKRVFLEVY